MFTPKSKSVKAQLEAIGLNSTVEAHSFSLFVCGVSFAADKQIKSESFWLEHNKLQINKHTLVLIFIMH